MKIFFLIIVLLFASPTVVMSQDLMDLIDEEETGYITPPFHGSRLILGHSVKTHYKNTLEVLITHRFGRVNLGAHELYGLDISHVRLGLEYGLSDRFNVGVGRSSMNKVYDGFLKYSIARQDNFPAYITLFSSLSIKTTPRKIEDSSYDFGDRMAETFQVLIARRLNKQLSVQLMPTWLNIHRVAASEKNSLAVLGVGGSYAITKSTSLNAEYYYRIDPPGTTIYRNTFSVGVDIETGGHVFQLHLTNSQMTEERGFLTETADQFFDGDIHFGFNISRTFQFDTKKKGWE